MPKGGKAHFQFLFAQDILGDGNHFPRHSKQYADLKKFVMNSRYSQLRHSSTLFLT